MNVGLFFCMLFLQALTDSSSLEPSISKHESFLPEFMQGQESDLVGMPGTS